MRQKLKGFKPYTEAANSRKRMVEERSIWIEGGPEGLLDCIEVIMPERVAIK